jgi:hypothetical protein
MIDTAEPIFSAPVPGEALTAELGSRPWQQPPQFSTVERAIEYYIPRLTSEEVSSSLMDVLEMGIPVTTVANTMQLAGVMEGKHSVDVGILVMPVLVEMISYMADAAGIEYDSGTEKTKQKIKSSLVDKALVKLQEEIEEPAEETESIEMEIVEEAEEPQGLMSRRT